METKLSYPEFMGGLMNYSEGGVRVCSGCGGSGWEWIMCCSGHECGCRGMPVDADKCTKCYATPIPDSIIAKSLPLNDSGTVTMNPELIAAAVDWWCEKMNGATDEFRRELTARLPGYVEEQRRLGRGKGNVTEPNGEAVFLSCNYSPDDFLQSVADAAGLPNPEPGRRNGPFPTKAIMWIFPHRIKVNWRGETFCIWHENLNDSPESVQ